MNMETGPRKVSGSTNSKPNNSTEISDSTAMATLPLVIPTKNNTTTDPMDIDQVVSPVPVGVIDTSSEPAATSSSDIPRTSEVLERVLYRLTGGLPKCELDLIVQESNDCEVALLDEIRILEVAHAALSKDEDHTESKDDGLPKNEATIVTKSTTDESTLHDLLDSPMTPLDRFYTASALLGRLRNDMAVPSTSSTKNLNRAVAITTATAMASPAIENNEEKAFEQFMDPDSPLHTMYTRTVVEQETLLSLWKKISMNRAAFVFKRPVKSEEAPGYTDRIYFPMDLSLIRKRIITNNIQTYIDFHHALALISHNCVKYNGRDSDYGRVARDFEAMVDHTIVQAVRHAASNDKVGTSKGITTAIVALSQDNIRQGTPISAMKETPTTTTRTTTGSAKHDNNSSTLSVIDGTTVPLITTPNDVKAKEILSTGGN